jgi:tyrosyl-tRNA synthetase
MVDCLEAVNGKEASEQHTHTQAQMHIYRVIILVQSQGKKMTRSNSNSNYIENKPCSCFGYYNNIIISAFILPS